MESLNFWCVQYLNTAVVGQRQDVAALFLLPGWDSAACSQAGSPYIPPARSKIDGLFLLFQRYSRGRVSFGGSFSANMLIYTLNAVPSIWHQAKRPGGMTEWEAAWRNQNWGGRWVKVTLLCCTGRFELPYASYLFLEKYLFTGELQFQSGIVDNPQLHRILIMYMLKNTYYPPEP